MNTLVAKYLLAFSSLLLLLQDAKSLSCFICGDSNLDEFGECSRQFQYDCGSYARRFPPQERLFCRTTRHKENNGSYTIMKECISERDHYQTFPKKNYPLDEECDLIEIEGKEIAYCLCRHNNLCNEKPITDQFIAFEELHPELFGDLEEETVQGVANMPIEPVNLPATPEAPIYVPDASRRVTISMNDRKQQLARGIATAEAERAFPAAPFFKNLSSSTNNWDMINQGAIAFVGQTPAVSKNSKETFGTSFENSHEDASDTSSRNSLKCMQCAQGTLKDEKTDCERQTVVDCNNDPEPSNEKSYCLTRQVLIEEGKNAIEKMCITSRSLVHVFGNRVTPNSCTFLEEENVRICTCGTPLCNQEPIYQQIMLYEMQTPPTSEISSSGSKVIDRKTPLKHCYTCSENALQQDGGDCVNAVIVECGKQINYEAETYCLTRQTELSKGVFSLEKLCVTEKQFEEDFPEENGLRLGCAEMFDGMIKYCVCSKDRCNQNPLAVQIGSSQNFSSRTGVPTRTTTQSVYITTSPIPIIQPGSAIRRTSPTERQLNEYSQSLFQDKEQHTTTISSYHSSLKEKLQESLLNERQNRWKETDSERSNNGSERNTGPSAVFLMLTTLTVVTFYLPINNAFF